MCTQSCLLQAPKPAISANELHLPESKQSVPYVITKCPQQWSQFTIRDLPPGPVPLGTLTVHAPSVLFLWMRSCHCQKNYVLRSESRCFPANNSPLWNHPHAYPLLIFVWVHRDCDVCIHSDLYIFWGGLVLWSYSQTQY